MGLVEAVFHYVGSRLILFCKFDLRLVNCVPTG